jgi:hypothetical protein
MRPAVLGFGLAACFLVAFFHHPASWNASSRLLTVYGLVEDGTLRADRFRGDIGDYAEVGGHVYSDKAPLSSFVVVPFYWVLRQLEGGSISKQDRGLAYHLGVLVASAIPFAAFAMLLLVRLQRERESPRSAVWMAGAAAFGTCLANYGGAYFGHMLAAALFLGSYVLACEREERFACAGALGGLSVLAEYPLALAQLVIFGYLLLGPGRWRRALAYGAGALPMALAAAAYNKAITGGWFDFPYSHVPMSMWKEMHTSFGLRQPDPVAMWELAFGQYRGLAFYAPLLLLAAPALADAFAGPRRRLALVAVLMGSYFILISSYFKWDGGYCLGPRHLAPVIALGVYEGAAAVARARRLAPLFYALAGWGGLVSLAGCATDPLPSERFQSPAFQLFFPSLWRGELSGHNLLAELGLPNGRYVVAAWVALFVGVTWSLARWSERLRARAEARRGEPATAAGAQRE